jgi:putative ATPase
MFMNTPLSDFLRPKSFDEVAGQEKTMCWIQKTIKTKKPLSVLFFGPPGSGKTTIAKLYAQSFNATIKTISAVFSSINDIKKIIFDAQNNPMFNFPTILFVDEIHRFNKAQQDCFLPFIENGTIILIGATTENPSFSLNNALLSRLRVLQLSHLTINDLNKILSNYEKKIRLLNLTQEAKDYLIKSSQGDARHLLNMIENLQTLNNEKIDIDDIKDLLQKKPALYDKAYENHYNLISALHKSIRGSDPDASLYWLARILEAGEDPLYISRRLIRVSFEDVGLADPNALNIAIHGDEIYRRLGSPEGDLALAEVVVYLALAPKSNRVYLAYEEAKKEAQNTSHLSPPMHILNAPTKLMKELGYSKGYIYDHDLKEGISFQNYFPEGLERKKIYTPKNIGFEKEMEKRIAYFEKLRKIKENK